ncbi:MAG: rod shape-determining protein MreD [Bacteroidales bacterium]|nr:rod shape-determining protein MreD [Bacteroidales bacterium]
MNNRLVLQNIIRLIILMLIQLIVLNNVTPITLLMPNIVLLFLLMMPTNTGRIPMLLISFFIGLLLDLFSNTLGFQCFAFTMVAMARILFADRMLLNNEPIDINCPSFRVVSFQNYTVYSITLLFIYYLTYIVLEAFSFYNVWFMVLSIFVNVIVTWILVIIYQLALIPEEKS